MELPLKAVCASLGLPADTVRKWEARHPGLVSPRRAPNGYRLYSEDDVRRLAAFSAARRRGLAGPRALAEAARGARRERAAAPVEEALAACARFDRRALLDLHRRALRGRAPAQAFERLWLPVLAELGRRAHEGAPAWVAVEHFTSAFLRERLLADAAGRPPRGAPRVALSSPAGDSHELGMLLAACALAESGVDPVYLGPDLPLEGLESALDGARPDALSLTLTARRTRGEVAALLSRLRRRFPTLPLFVCGSESVRHAALVARLGAVFVGTDLSRGLRAVADRLAGARR